MPDNEQDDNMHTDTSALDDGDALVFLEQDASRLVRELINQQRWLATALYALMESERLAGFSMGDKPGAKKMRVVRLGGTIYIYDENDNKLMDTVAPVRGFQPAASGDASEGRG